MWPAASSSCWLDFPTVMDHTLTGKPKETLFPWVAFFRVKELRLLAFHMSSYPSILSQTMRISASIHYSEFKLPVGIGRVKQRHVEGDASSLFLRDWIQCSTNTCFVRLLLLKPHISGLSRSPTLSTQAHWNRVSVHLNWWICRLNSGLLPCDTVP